MFGEDGSCVDSQHIKAHIARMTTHGTPNKEILIRFVYQRNALKAKRKRREW